MTEPLFPERIETERLLLERMSPARTDLFEVYDLVNTESWQGVVTEHMPWFRFDTLDNVAKFVAHVDEQWTNRERARYTVRLRDGEPDAGALAGFASLLPEWDTRRAGTDIVLARRFWGREYAVERVEAFLELTFERLDLDAYYTTVAAENERSKRMIEKYVDRFGGRYEGLLRQYKPRPNGEVTDQHRYTILRDEYFAAIS